MTASSSLRFSKSFPRLTAAELISSYPVHSTSPIAIVLIGIRRRLLDHINARLHICMLDKRSERVRISESFAGKGFTEQRLDYAIKARGRKKWVASGQKPISSRPWCSEFFKASETRLPFPFLLLTNCMDSYFSERPV